MSVRYLVQCDDCGTIPDLVDVIGLLPMALGRSPSSVREGLKAAGWGVNLRILVVKGRMWDLCPRCLAQYEMDRTK